MNSMSEWSGFLLDTKMPGLLKTTMKLGSTGARLCIYELLFCSALLASGILVA